MNATKGESAGVARLSANYGNVISVGAVERVGMTTYGGLLNAYDVQRASYSNFGSALTLTAPVDAPAMDKFGLTIFDGTSCANPHVAGVASLVWSVNTGLRGDEVRQILIDTAMDVGAAGRDNDFGYGLVNADAAVRRAVALARDKALALLVPMGDSSPQLAGYSTSSPSRGLAHPSRRRPCPTTPTRSQLGRPAHGASASRLTPPPAALGRPPFPRRPSTPRSPNRRRSRAAVCHPARAARRRSGGPACPQRRPERGRPAPTAGAALLDEVFALAFDATLETALLRA